MKNRIFVLSFAVLVLAVTAVSFTYVKFFRDERQSLIDQELQLLASSLLASRIDTTELEQIGDLVADALGEDRLLAIVSLYAADGHLLYRNDNGEVLFEDQLLPVDPERYSLTQGVHELRFLNLRLLPSKQHLQVGFLLDKSQLRFGLLKRSAGVYVGIIFSILLLASFFLSQALVRPLKNLSFYLERLTQAIEEARPLPELPQSFGVAAREDEFARLARTVRTLGKKLQNSFAMSQASAAQMAHELKTPLTVIHNQLERMRLQMTKTTVEESVVVALEEGVREVEHLSQVISEFLDWASLQSGPKDEVFAIKVADCAKEMIEQLNKLESKARIQLKEIAPLTVFARQEAVLQAIRNLLENAMKYSPAGTPIEVIIDAKGIIVLDQGPGIPETVLSRLGQPFNSGPRIAGIRSTGLGLAWVKTLCDRYGWELKLERVEQKTRVTIGVPEDASA